MFLLNSRLGLLTAAPRLPIALRRGASLFPKLRDYFAEFLNVVSLAHLGLLDPSTCVGLRYGPAGSGATAAFLGALQMHLLLASRSGYRVAPATTSSRWHARAARVAAFTLRPGAGMFACCPSATPFGLALGPGLPWEDEPGPGNLGFAVGGIRTRLFVTHACMVTRTRSTHPHGRTSTHVRRSPTNAQSAFRGFGCPLQSRSFSARGFSASALLRDLQMVAASEPTSWLSWKPHILTIHSADY